MIEREQMEQGRSFEQEGPMSSPVGDARTEGPGRDEEAQAARKGTANRGFAAMDPEKQRRIASEGGRAAHKQGVAHEWSRDEAREAGRKGGQMVSRNREYMSEIGRRGGQTSGQRRQRNAPEAE